MKKKSIFATLIMAFLIYGCAAPESPTQPPVGSPIATVPTLTSTSVPILTATEQPATPTLTPEPGLRTKGPYFSYFQEIQGIRRLVLMNADGIGRKVIELPEAISNSFAIVKPPQLNMDLLSPDGHWLAFYTGSAGDYNQMPAPAVADLALNLLDLQTGEQQVVTRLLSEDYPNNFVEAAAKLNDEYKTPESLYQAFQYGIRSAIAWSPDGRYLAFAGQMDGLSSDLYVYDVQAKSIQRLSSGDQELQWIDWSPDGKWILHGSLFAVGAGMTFDVYAAAVNGSSAPYLSTSPMGVDSWLNDHQYIEHDAANGPGNYGLRIVDVRAGTTTKLWDGAFQQYTVSPSGKWMLLFAMTSLSPYPYQEDPADFRPGWKLINLQTLEKADAPEFLADPPNAFLRAQDGELIPLIMKPYNMGVDHVSRSPDSQYWIVINDDEVKILSADLSVLNSLAAPSSSLGDMLWSPDSSGLFLIYEAEIYFLNVSDGSMNLIETDLIDDNYNAMYKWVNPQ